MGERAVSVRAILLGWLTWVLAQVTLGVLLAGVIGAIGPMPAHLATRVSGYSVPLKALGLFNVFWLTVFGGYLSARIARHSELKHATLMGALAAVTGGILVIILPDPSTIIEDLVTLVAIMPAALLGGHLRRVMRSEEGVRP